MAPLTAVKREWRHSDSKGYYKITTSRADISLDFVNSAFAHPDMHWASPLSTSELETLLDNSLTLGLYTVSEEFPAPSTASSPSSPRTPSPTLEAPPTEYLQQIGMARLITDGVTTVYLTDVFITEEWRGRGLAVWLVECCRDIIQGMPKLRRALLMATPGPPEDETGGPAVRFYKKVLGMKVMGRGDDILAMTYKPQSENTMDMLRS